MDYIGSEMYGSASPAPSPGASLISSPGAIVKEKIPAAADTDTSTKQTVAKMCEYINAGVSDDVCRRWALAAWKNYAQQSSDPGQLCWGVWWLVKHAVKFAKDEPRLFAVGEPEALDLLIAPAVLVREAKPKEDCDGFTMLVCCLLKILGIPSVIVTVAADPDDPGRWSHVFPMATLPTGNVPLDASHGKFPGWMVPRDHVFRWQAWDLNGQPVNAAPPAQNTLHGYMPTGARMPRARRRRGVGDDSETGDFGGSVGDSGGGYLIQGPTAFQAGLPEVGGVVPNGITSFVSPTSSGSDTDWSSVINSLFSGGLKAATLATLPPGYVMGANGQPVYTGQAVASAQLTSSFASILPWLGIGLVAVLVLPALMGKK